MAFFDEKIKYLTVEFFLLIKVYFVISNNIIDASGVVTENKYSDCY